MRHRDELLAWLRHQGEVEVLIIGGGINGAGVLRDLAAQGVGALLVERGDFCSGTSAAPSRLIHGGLRYLETGEIALVRESVEERNLLLINAPHLVVQLQCWVPILSWMGGALTAFGRFLRLVKDPRAKGAAVVKLGLVIYDVLGRKHRTMPVHRMVSAGAARRIIPDLSHTIKAVAEYYDARLVHPERLTLEVIADAESDCLASRALNYVEVEGIDGGKVVLRDTRSRERFTVAPKLVVNASGAWVDGVQGRMKAPDKLIGGTKGVHLVIAHPAIVGELGGRMLYFETSDHRACLVYPLDERHILLGTTDTRTDDPDDTVCSEADIRYLFTELRQILPAQSVRREDIVFTYGGVRPLPKMDVNATGSISRDHVLRPFEPTPERPFPVLTLVGGKWTTYRACAAQIADVVLARLGLARKSGTQNLPIGGGHDFPRSAAGVRDLVAAIAASSGTTPSRSAVLVRRYGTAAKAFAAEEQGGQGKPLTSLPDYTVQEIQLICGQERVQRLSDVILRRTLMAFEGVATTPAIVEVAGIVGARLGWDDARRGAEIEHCVTLLRQRHGVRLEPVGGVPVHGDGNVARLEPLTGSH